MGLAISGRPYTLKVYPDKMKDLIICTEAIVVRGVVRPRELSTVVGSWAWGMLVCRPAFAILDARYQWIGRYQGDESEELQTLPSAVRGERRALAPLALFFEANLERGWHATVYMTDASDEGFAAVATKSSVEATRQELGRGTEQARQIRVEEAHKVD